MEAYRCKSDHALIYSKVNPAFRAKVPERAWASFGLARNACLSCHEAENVAVMNRQPLFRRTEKAPQELLN
jgi:hypothetical protein